MASFGIITRSLRRKLVLAFILVAVPPMLIASHVATDALNASVNANVERWLRNTAGFIFSALQESEEELDAVHTLLTSRFSGQSIAFNEREYQAFAALDADAIVLRDEEGGVLFTSPGVRAMDPEPLFEGSTFYWVHMEDGRRELATVVRRCFAAADGSRRTLELGNLFAIELSETGADEPVSVRIFLPTKGGFSMAFSSVGGDPPGFAGRLAELHGDAEALFIPDPDWTDNVPNAHHLLLGLRDPAGRLLAVFAITAHMLDQDGQFPTSRQLFWVFFILGTLFSGCMGYVLATGIVRPVKRLRAGVKNIEAGNLNDRIDVQGNDELAELSEGFNLMAKQLEVMRHEGIVSARQDRSRMLGEIALGFAHEIRNPLVVIKTSAELVHNTLPNGVRESRLMGFVVEEVGRIDSLIKEFLSFANPTPVSLRPFDLSTLVREAMEISGPEFEKNGIAFSFACEISPAVVLGEQNQIRQVLLNLFLNAKDAMVGGGALRMRLYAAPGAERICLEVRDNGPGIPEHMVPTMFLPFASGKKNGLGLGLAKSQAIMEAHGGSISGANAAGGGAVFTLCLNKG